MMKIYFKFIIILFLSFGFTSCKEEERKKTLHLFYVIIDKSSNSYSSSGGKEENFIQIDSIYINNFIEKIYSIVNQNSNSDLVLFFNYVDENIEGNKELFLKIKSTKILETEYKSNGQVVSSKKEFLEKLAKDSLEIKNQFNEFRLKRQSLFSDLKYMLSKSEEASGSDCSNLLKFADKKLEQYQIYFVDTLKYHLGKKMILAFSDLVNYPENNEKIDIKNFVVRPGYTGKVEYLNDNKLMNITTQDEFDDFIFNTLKK